MNGNAAFAGRAVTAGGAPVWQNITDADNPGFPFGRACGIAITGQGINTYIKVLTTDNRVYQTHGDTNGTNFVWDEGWTELTPAPAPVLRGKAFKGGTVRGATPNGSR
ncbi:hypothetical protein [Streptomyces erythrochromogenes]|uniref:hypothetical protein n=1 Tax=Streptomyces erythrochromogenes TaxID=285574 RepID=UPI0038634962|nr:hypothetical protein OG364_20775 [Streptomyces erythrochromogenes]